MTERLYYADAFTTEFDAEVVEVRELSRERGQSMWRVALDRTAFYPTSGGQPYDTGYLIEISGDGTALRAEVTDVEEDDNGEVWHDVAKPLTAGMRVHGSVDADRRLDHVQQHSGQHLLSAVFYQICGARTVSFHLGGEVSTVDLAVDGLERQICLDAEEMANRVIAEDRPVASSFVSRVQAEQWLASGTMRKLPARTGDLRIVEIPGVSAPLDRNACGGTHVHSTGQIGSVQIRRVEKAGSNWRVEFVCGLRAVHAAHLDFEGLTEAARRLSVGLTEVPEAIVRLQTELKQASRRIEIQQSELAGYQAAKLIHNAPVSSGCRILQLQLAPPEVAGPPEAKHLVAACTAQGEPVFVIAAWSPLAANEGSTLIFAQSGDFKIDCGGILRSILAAHGGRGGGTKTMAQGSIPRQSLSMAIDALVAAAREALPAPNAR